MLMLFLGTVVVAVLWGDLVGVAWAALVGSVLASLDA
jgi:hypothetical protein